MLLELPEEDLPEKEFHHDWVAQILVTPAGDRAFTVTERGAATTVSI